MTKFRCVRCGHVFVSRTSRERRCSKCRSRLILSERDYNFVVAKLRELEESRTPVVTGLMVLNDVFKRLKFTARPVLTLNMLNRIAREVRRTSRRRLYYGGRARRSARRSTGAAAVRDPLREVIDRLETRALENAIEKLAETEDVQRLFPRVYYRELSPLIGGRRVKVKMWYYFDLSEKS
ncbi:MAG TPA: hypothetical protein ENF26_05525 [Methanomicrobia archaeon]|nr:hypothetical protein [Methanomicrobia archaeon]HEX59588.1 hypothetical protein [Methanomicrobia archaeon]